MPFPESKRVLYRKNPLNQVISQFRFPPILRIDVEIPAPFQERIRKHFPHFSEKLENIVVPPDLSHLIRPELMGQPSQLSAKNYEFSSEDGHWKINLTRTFVALTTTKYERWEQFKEKLKIPLDALVEVYAPDHFSRIGLRYVDIIRRSALNLSDVPWRELLQPYILGILGAPEVGDHVSHFMSQHEVRLSDNESMVRIITGFVNPEADGEMCYMIDSDFYNSHKTKIESAMERLDYFNGRASRLIQWCISERLHNAMEPELL